VFPGLLSLELQRPAVIAVNALAAISGHGDVVNKAWGQLHGDQIVAGTQRRGTTAAGDFTWA
jgi:hypothetical protein